MENAEKSSEDVSENFNPVLRNQFTLLFKIQPEGAGLGLGRS